MKLYAVYDRDGNLAHNPGCTAFVGDVKWKAWSTAGFYHDKDIRRAKRAGYTCVEVEIVRNGERDGSS